MTVTIPVRVRWLAAVLVGLTAAPAAHGFYFRGWPGDRPGPPSLLPADPLFDNTPPGFVTHPIPGHPTPGGPGDIPDPGDVGEPGNGPGPNTPEPGTLALAALGLGAVAVARRVRRGPAAG